VSIAGLFFGGDAVRNALTVQFRSLLGPTGSQAVEAMLKGADSTSGGTLTGIMGIVLLLVAALGVVVQLKDALNTIWETKESEGAGVWWYLRTYLISFAGILALMLAVSLVVSTGLAAPSSWMGGGESLFWQIVNFLVSLAALGFMFAMLFKWIPDAVVRWREALIGGLATALLFNLGKLAIGWYIGKQGLESTHGAAASLAVLLIWVYYSAQIVPFGAEVTRVLTKAQVRQPQ
jgi:membrane protein